MKNSDYFLTYDLVWLRQWEFQAQCFHVWVECIHLFGGVSHLSHFEDYWIKSEFKTLKHNPLNAAIEQISMTQVAIPTKILANC